MVGPQNNKDLTIAVPIVMAAVFSFLYLDKPSLWLDESFSVAFASLGWAEFGSLVSSLETNMSLYYLLLKIWISIFGDSEFAVRSLSAMLAVLTVAIIYSFTLRLFNKRVALVAGLLLASNAYFIRYAQATRSYSLLLFLTAVSMFLFVLALEKQKLRLYVWHGVVNALVFYTHFLGVLVLIGQIVLVLMVPKEAVNLRRITISVTTTVLLALPLVVLVLLLPPTKFQWWVGEAKPTFLNIVGIFTALSGNGGKVALALYFACGVSSIVFAVRKLDVLIDRQMLLNYSLILFWFVFPIASLLLFSFFVPAFRTRYLITALPALVIIVALGLAYINHVSLQRIAISLVVAVSVVNLFGQYYLSPSVHRDWRAAAQTVLTNSQPGDAIVFYSWMAQYPFDYYYRRVRRSDASVNGLNSVWPSPFYEASSGKNVDTFYDNLNSDRELSSERLEELTKDRDRLWVVLAFDQMDVHGWNSKPIISSVDELYEEKTVFSMDQLTIILYRVKRS